VFSKNFSLKYLDSVATLKILLCTLVLEDAFRAQIVLAHPTLLHLVLPKSRLANHIENLEGFSDD